jgi:hypothetical protein
MSNWIDLRLDVLASGPEEINKIERALQEPCDELIAWRAQLCSENPEDIAANIKEIVSFKPIRNLGYVHPSVNKARRFASEWKDRFWGLVWGHVHFVSRDFPRAIFLAQYWDDQMSYGGKRVFHAGDEIRSSRDNDHHAMGCEWVLPNIFAPFQTEHELGVECGTLWDEWIKDMRKELAELTEWYGSATVLPRERRVSAEDGNQEPGGEE